MTNDQDVTLGEVHRLVQSMSKDVNELRAEVRDRHHKLSGEVSAVIGPISMFGLRMDNAEDALKEHAVKIREVELRSAGYAGGFTVLGYIVSYFFGRH